MIYFGTFKGEVSDMGPTLSLTCPSCNTKGDWHLLRQRHWVSLNRIPLFPYDAEYQIICIECLKGIVLDSKETKDAKVINRMMQQLSQEGNLSQEIGDVIDESGLLLRAQSIVARNVNKDSQAPWNKLNDKICEAIELSNYKPKQAADRLAVLLSSGVNINARSDSGKTVLSFAQYVEAPSLVIKMLLNAGALDPDVKESGALDRTMQKFWESVGPEADSAVLASQLLHRVASLARQNVNTDPQAPWTEMNDKLCEAIELSNYRPKDAFTQLEFLLGSAVNINARTAGGKTLLSFAQYVEAPSVVIEILKKAGAKQ